MASTIKKNNNNKQTNRRVSYFIRNTQSTKLWGFNEDLVQTTNSEPRRAQEVGGGAGLS